MSGQYFDFPDAEDDRLVREILDKVTNGERPPTKEEYEGALIAVLALTRQRERAGSAWLGPMSYTDAAQWSFCHDTRGERFKERYVDSGRVKCHSTDQPRKQMFLRWDLESLRTENETLRLGK